VTHFASPGVPLDAPERVREEFLLIIHLRHRRQPFIYCNESHIRYTQKE